MLSAALSGLVTGLALIIAIGAQNAFVLRQGLQRQHVGLLVAVCALSDALLIAAGIAGLGALFDRHPVLLAVARYGGAAFLLGYAFLAARRAWAGGQLTLEKTEPMALRSALLTALALTFLNPHVYLDTVVLLGALANQRPEHERWVFGGGAMLGSVLWFSALGYGARLLTPIFAKPTAWRVLDGLIAVVMASLGAALLVG